MTCYCKKDEIESTSRENNVINSDNKLERYEPAADIRWHTVLQQTLMCQLKNNIDQVFFIKKDLFGKRKSDNSMDADMISQILNRKV